MNNGDLSRVYGRFFLHPIELNNWYALRKMKAVIKIEIKTDKIRGNKKSKKDSPTDYYRIIIINPKPLRFEWLPFCSGQGWSK